MLTAENYFSPENNLKYMGSSQFKAFQKCEASALAEIKGEYAQEKTEALLVGSYVDSHFENTLDVFKAKTPEIFSQKGALLAKFSHANDIIARIERDPMFMNFMSGEKQVIMTGEIEGIPFKIKIDSYHLGKCIVDLKVMKDFKPIWVDGCGKVPFVEAWGYDIQAAIYQAVEGHDMPFFIAGATKEKEPDIAIMSIPQEIIDMQLFNIKNNAKRFDDIKKGLIEPVRCGKCDYCKSTKILTEIIDYREVD